MAPISEWETASNYFGSFYLDGDLTVDMVDMNPDTEKIYVFNIGDTQGNTYTLDVVQ